MREITVEEMEMVSGADSIFGKECKSEYYCEATVGPGGPGMKCGVRVTCNY